MKNKALIIFLIFLFFGAIAGLLFVFLEEDIVIEAYEAELHIDDAGNIEVNETFMIDFREKYYERWRDVGFRKSSTENPLYKGLAYDEYRYDKGTFISGEVVAVYKDGIDVTNKVRIGYSFDGDVDKYGEPIKALKDKYAESLYVDATNAGGLEGEMIFEYRYTLGGMVTQFNDISELNYRIFEYMEADIKKAYVSVYIDDSLTGFKETDFYSYGHGINKGEIVQSVINKSNVAQPEFLIAGKNIKKNQFFEFRLLMPNSIFNNIKEENIVRVDMKQKIVDYEYGLYLETRNATIALIFSWIITVGVIGAVIVLIIFIYRKYDKEHKATFDGEYYRELPNESRTPAEMSYLYYFGKTIDEDVTATMLDLIRRNILKLDVNGESVNSNNPNFILYFNRDEAQKAELKEHERVLINWFIGLIGNGESVSLVEIEKYPVESYTKAKEFENRGKSFKAAVRNECKNHDYFEKNLSRGKMEANLYGAALVFGPIITIVLWAMFNIKVTACIVIMLIAIAGYFAYVGSIKKRSIAGNEEYAKWCAFKNFLEDFSSFEDYPIPGIVVWEHYLVYATSLKIADKVMEQLEVKLPKYDEEHSTYMRTSYYGYYYSPHMCIGSVHRTMKTARQNAMTTISVHNMSSGGSGRGGGFTRGSSFGGGGGGGRVR